MILVFLLASCAGLYKNINSSSIYYNNGKDIIGDLNVAYEYNLHKKFNNNKYRKRESSTNYVAIALKVKNNTNKEIILEPQTFLIFIDNNKVETSEILDYYEQVKQGSVIYLAHAIWGPWVTNNGVTTFWPIGLGFGLINLIVAEIENTKFKNNLIDQYIFGKLIKPNETIFGLLFLKDYKYENLDFKYLER